MSSGVFGSFTDAPGDFDDETNEFVKGSATKEELNEIIFNFGIEYWYDNLLAFRGGFFHENRLKGGRQFITAGFGLRYQMMGLDVAYIIPLTPNHPLAETVRIGLILNMKDIAGGGEDSILE